MAAVCRRTEAILAQDTEKEHGGLKDVTPGPSEVIANPALEVANATPADVPATLPFPSPARKRRRWGRIALLVLMLATAAVGSYYWWKSSHDELPRGIVSSNGRIEADEIDVATKFAGRVAELRVEEGDMVSAGEVVARMDTRDLEASLKRAEAHVLQAQRAIDEARATEDQQRTQVALAKQQFDRTSYLMQRGNATQELLDQRRQQLDGATASLNAATARIAQTEHALAAAEHEVELLTVNISDNSLVAPRDGRVQYRIARIGEVLPAGGKVLTLIDISYVYMDIYLPTLDAGQAKVGTEARIVLDAYPNIAIPGQSIVHRNTVSVYA